ncbi:hypothetical protein SKAU_G00337850 [Synaphobranchus kaupii]|uniref:Uncharacterized protein n=1 Tax=Synaphobranchus kaupii TaxID=118154 RepID=A0A9Q1EMC8_SYNKA|nr:hypothetical protein SKAU_G00337850 [Synaphobranchus kaupii]
MWSQLISSTDPRCRRRRRADWPGVNAQANARRNTEEVYCLQSHGLYCTKEINRTKKGRSSPSADAALKLQARGRSVERRLTDQNGARAVADRVPILWSDSSASRFIGLRRCPTGPGRNEERRFDLSARHVRRRSRRVSASFAPSLCGLTAAGRGPKPRFPRDRARTPTHPPPPPPTGLISHRF